MRIPHDQLQLKLALMQISDELAEKISSPEFQHDVRSRFDASPAAINLTVAEANGINVLDLINSPNYEALVKAHKASVIVDFLQSLQDQGFTSIQAWAVVAVMYDLIEL